MKHDRRLLSLLLAASSCFFGPWPSPAAAQLLGPEFQVTTHTTLIQEEPAVAADDSGDFVVVWNSFGQDGSNEGVFGRRFDATGLPLGIEFQVNSYTVDSQSMPRIAMDGAGNFVVVWNSYRQDGSDFGKFGQRFDSAGNPLGIEFQVNTYTTNPQWGGGVASDELGSFVVVWGSLGQDGSNEGILGRRFDAAGVPLGIEFQVNSFTLDSQFVPRIAKDGAGNSVVVWTSHGQDGSGYGVFGQRLDSAGLPVGSEFQVNSYTTNHQSLPAVVADGAGNFVVVWRSDGQIGSGFGVIGQRFDSAGAPIGSEFQVNSYTTSDPGSPVAAADGSGNLAIVWDARQDGWTRDVFGQLFNSAGARVGTQFRVNSSTTGAQDSPMVAATGMNSFVVVWDTSAPGFEVLGRSVTTPFFYDGFESGDFGGWSSVCNDGDVCP